MVGKLSTVKMSILPLQANVISIKYQDIFPGTRQDGYKIHLEEKTSKNNYKNPGKGMSQVEWGNDFYHI